MSTQAMCTEEAVIQNKVYETVTLIFITMDDPQFKMCWCIFPACMCLHWCNQAFMITYVFYRCNSIDFLSCTHIYHARIDHLYNPGEMMLEVWMWKFIWLCTVCSSEGSSYVFVEKEKCMTFLKYVMWHSISLHLIDKQAGSYIFCQGRQA